MIVYDTSDYRLSYEPESDELILLDGKGRRMASGPLKPNFAFADGSYDSFLEGAEAEARLVSVPTGGLSTLTVNWKTARGSLLLTLQLYAERFEVLPLKVSSPSSSRWARLELFAGLSTHYVLLPGLSMSSFVSPVVDLYAKFNLTTTLGAGAMRGPGLAQQWGLPAHYLALYNTSERWNGAGARNLESDSLCLGLAELPEGDFWVRTGERCLTLVLNLRSDLWNLLPDNIEITTGLHLLGFVGRDLEAAPRAYYRHLANQGSVAGSAYPHQPAARDVRSWTLFNTWGSQVNERIQPEQLDQTRLEGYRSSLLASGLKVGHFVIDDKWEGAYGVLTHDAQRFPHFEAFLNTLRADGYKVGLWAAFLRCEDPQRVGLTENHLMKGYDGKVLWLQHQSARYGIYDISQDEVAHVLGRLAREFMERYRPELIKFDFGYELPILDVSCPANRNYRGERLLRRGLEVLLGAMKAVNPELVVFYYGLSPLLAPYYDLHSTDDMVYCPRDYDLEGNRRMTLAALLGENGMPVSSSTGYDWDTACDLWFDSVALGVPGTLLPFGPGETEAGPTPAVLARFNGLSALARASNRYQFESVSGHPHGGHRAMTTSGWRRLEHGQTVLLALRNDCSVPDLEHQGQVVVASLDQALAGTRHFGFVGWPGSSFRLPVGTTSTWTVTEHRLRGSSSVGTLKAASTLEFPWPAVDDLEWVEFQAK